MLHRPRLRRRVWELYLAEFPDAGSVRLDVNGTPTCPAREYVHALVDALCAGVEDHRFWAVVAGTGDSPGSVQVQSLRPRSHAALQRWRSEVRDLGWDLRAGRGSAMGQICVRDLIDLYAQQAQLQVFSSDKVGTGFGSLDGLRPLSVKVLERRLLGALSVAFARPLFCPDFDVNKGLNAQVSATFPAWASAWAVGIGGLRANLVLTGTGAPAAGTQGLVEGRLA